MEYMYVIPLGPVYNFFTIVNYVTVCMCFLLYSSIWIRIKCTKLHHSGMKKVKHKLEESTRILKRYEIFNENIQKYNILKLFYKYPIKIFLYLF